MPTVGSISELGYLSLRTQDLAGNIRNAVEVLGLHEVETTSKKAALSAQAKSQEIVYTEGEYDAVDHIGVVAASVDDLEAIREKVDRAGYRILSEGSIETGVGNGFAFVGPSGYAWQVYTEQAEYSIVKSGGFGPDRIGHINVQTTEPLVVRDFLISIFDFRVSDQIGEDAGFFLRANNEHHAVAILKSPVTKLHHHAWQTQGIVDLGRLGDRLARRGSRLAWGPVRHGAGDNIAAYYVEPSGAVIELYTDMEHIFDKERPARVWDEADPYWLNQWDGQFPAWVLDRGIPPLER